MVTKDYFEKVLNKQSVYMTGAQLTYDLTKANIRGRIRGRFGTLLRRHNPKEFNKRFLKFQRAFS